MRCSASLDVIPHHLGSATERIASLDYHILPTRGSALVGVGSAEVWLRSGVIEPGRDHGMKGLLTGVVDGLKVSCCFFCVNEVMLALSSQA